MDPSLLAASRALAVGDALAALTAIATRRDPDALALRGLAMAQLGDSRRALALLARARASFPIAAQVERARCDVAEAEVRLARHDLDVDVDGLAAAERTLRAHGERDNATRARLLAARVLLLRGDPAGADRMLVPTADDGASQLTRATRALLVYDIALRLGDARRAEASAEQAIAAATRTGIAALAREAASALARVHVPVARRMHAGTASLASLLELDAHTDASHMVVDALRRRVLLRGEVVPLATRPVLLALARRLAATYPLASTRDALAREAFGARRIDASVRARLRVEIGRLRKLLAPHAAIEARSEGFALVLPPGAEVVVVAPLDEGADAALLALLADGTPWPAASLARSLGRSPRTVQRALVALEAAGLVALHGRGKARRAILRPAIDRTQEVPS